MTIHEVARALRARLLRREGEALFAISSAYEQVELVMLERLLALIEQLERDDPSRPISWLVERDRLNILLAQVAGEVANWSDLTTRIITGSQRDAVAMATQAAVDFYEAEGGYARIGVEWDRLPAEALEQFVGTLGDGSPLQQTFAKYPAVAAQNLQDDLLEGIAQGRNPREIARRFKKSIRDKPEIPVSPSDKAVRSLGDLKQNAELITRTEFNRSHRQAAVENYRANFDTAIGYRRISALDTRTCPACWALHGKLYKLDQDVHEHPQCRCTVAPVFSTSDEFETGGEVFERLDDAKKKEILGPAKFAEYKAGNFGLADYAETFHSAKWGPQLREASLARLQGRSRKEKKIRATL